MKRLLLPVNTFAILFYRTAQALTPLKLPRPGAQHLPSPSLQPLRFPASTPATQDRVLARREYYTSLNPLARDFCHFKENSMADEIPLSLLMLERRLAFLKKCSHPFFLIMGRKSRME